MGAGDHLKRKESMLVRKEATTVSVSQGFGILKKSKEALAALDLLALEDGPEGGMDTWMDRWLETKAEAAAEADRPAKKRKRVVKQRLPKSLIDHMVACPYRTIEDLSPVQLANRSEEYRRFHALTTFVDGKMCDYEKALIDQYNALGYAEDECEVTDNEEEDVTAEN